MELKKYKLCACVFCANIKCRECPADNIEETYTPWEAEQWWLEHWDFKKDQPRETFTRGELVLVSDDGKEWHIGFFVEKDEKQCWPYFVSTSANLKYTQNWKMCKKYVYRNKKID